MDLSTLSKEDLERKLQLVIRFAEQQMPVMLGVAVLAVIQESHTPEDMRQLVQEALKTLKNRSE